MDLYTKADLEARQQTLAAKRTRFAGEDLKQYLNHYTMLAYRSSTGSAEVHEHDADIFFITDGQCDILLGGTVQKPVTMKAGEIRGASLAGGTRKRLATGDVIHIDAKVPHQMIIAAGQHVTYFVVKVSGQ